MRSVKIPMDKKVPSLFDDYTFINANCRATVEVIKENTFSTSYCPGYKQILLKLSNKRVKGFITELLHFY